MRSLPPAPKMGDLSAVYFWWMAYSAALRDEAEGRVYLTEPWRDRRRRLKRRFKLLARAVRKAGFRK